MRSATRLLLLGTAICLALPGCSGDGPRGGPPGGGRGPGAGPPDRDPAAAVPVEIAAVERRAISSYIETNGTLEAENEVDIAARVAAPIVELLVEEGDAVRAGQLLARLEEVELRAQLDIARVTVEETRQAHERARVLFDQKLISSEAFDQASAAHETARAQFETRRILLGYARIHAPFAGLIVARYVDAAEQLTVGQPLFRISDFDPLLCPIQVPERDLSRLHIRQRAWLAVESWPGERFAAEVLRISPVVDAASGTIKVTLQVTPPDRLRPGMFARVFLEAETKSDALVIPKAALSLESIGDTVYVAHGGMASRREVTLGFEEGDSVEVLTGVSEGESVVVVGQDGLSDGTPIQVLEAPTSMAAGRAPGEQPRLDPSQMTSEQLEQLKERLRARGMSDEEIDRRLERMRERAGQGAE